MKCMPTLFCYLPMNQLMCMRGGECTVITLHYLQHGGLGRSTETDRKCFRLVSYIIPLRHVWGHPQEADRSAGRQNTTPSLCYIICFKHPSRSSSQHLLWGHYAIFEHPCMRVLVFATRQVPNYSFLLAKWGHFLQSGAILAPPTTQKRTVWGSWRDLKVEVRTGFRWN